MMEETEEWREKSGKKKLKGMEGREIEGEVEKSRGRNEGREVKKEVWEEEKRDWDGGWRREVR